MGILAPPPRRGAPSAPGDPCSEIIPYALPIWFFGRVREGLFDSKSRLPQIAIYVFSFAHWIMAQGTWQ